MKIKNLLLPSPVDPAWYDIGRGFYAYKLVEYVEGKEHTRVLCVGYNRNAGYEIYYSDSPYDLLNPPWAYWRVRRYVRSVSKSMEDRKRNAKEDWHNTLILANQRCCVASALDDEASAKAITSALTQIVENACAGNDDEKK